MKIDLKNYIEDNYPSQTAFGLSQDLSKRSAGSKVHQWIKSGAFIQDGKLYGKSGRFIRKLINHNGEA